MFSTDTPDFLDRFLKRMHEDDNLEGERPTKVRPRSLAFANREVGRGGLGVVYVFRDKNLLRDVAVKIAKKQVLTSDEKLDRFEREYRLTARLQHPGIPAIYGSGKLRDGRPYYVMRLLSGRSLLELIRNYHDDADANANERAELFEQILSSLITCCEAAAHAHDVSILHRDIKPNNIVVEANGSTFLIDWGMAVTRHGKSASVSSPPSQAIVDSQAEMASEAETQFGRYIGTPAYMSPEQASGRPQDHSESTDVYGLGATLFHILTGNAPHASIGSKSPIGDWKTVIIENPQPSVDRFPPGTPPELVSICRTAMAAKKCDRYENAKSLAADIRRWQRHELVEAHRPHYRITDRLWFFMQAHRRIVFAASVLMLASLIVLTTSTYFVNKARQDQSAQRERERAVNELLLSDLENWANSVMQDEMLASELLQPLRLQYLNQLSARYEFWIEHDLGSADGSTDRAVRGLLQLGRIHQQTGDLEASLATCQRAMNLVAELPPHTFPDGTAEQLGWLYASILNQLGKSEEAEARLRAIITELPTRRHLVRPQQLRANLLHAVAKVCCSVADRQANWEIRSEYYRTALRDFETEASIWESIKEDQQDFEAMFGLTAAMNGQAIALHKTGHANDAIVFYDRSLQLLKEMQQIFLKDEERKKIFELKGTVLANMGMSHVALQDDSSAEQVYRTAIATYQNLNESLPLVIGYREELARAWGNLADLHEHTGAFTRKPDQVMELRARQQVIRLCQSLAKERPHVNAYREMQILHMVRLCCCLHRSRRDDQATEVFRQLLEVTDSPENVEHLNPRQRVMCALGYELLAKSMLTDHQDPAHPNWKRAHDLRTRAQRLLVNISSNVFAKSPEVYAFVIQDPVFREIMESDDRDIQHWLRGIESLATRTPR